MERVAYYPGCALKERSSHLDSSARAALEKLDIKLDEIENWTCCGAVPPPSEERIMNLVAPVRILRNLRDSGEDIVVTICDFCYNVLKRANHTIRTDEIKRTRINKFLNDDEPEREYIESREYDKPEYCGEVRVFHLFEYLRDIVGFETISEKVLFPLEGLKIAPYYGCVMLRPESEIGLDKPENPSIMEEFIKALSAEPVKYPYRTECCGSYLSVSAPVSSMRLCHRILTSAQDRGADAILVSCPLCFYNLESKQKDIIKEFTGFKGIPVIYFTQLLAIAMGIEEKVLEFNKHCIDVMPLFQESAWASKQKEKP
jgi:heterodisulfide reductase subunit B